LYIRGIELPDELWTRLKKGEVVVFGGAGVSSGPPANLPLFQQLVREIAMPLLPSPEELEAPDSYLGKLSSDVHRLAAKILKARNPEPTPLHLALVRLFQSDAETRIVTTNFDDLFAQAATRTHRCAPTRFVAPALPLGHAFNGIVHVHGALDSPGEMVLTDTDFGRAYLTEGWARRFLLQVFSSSSVLFVGYSHDDTIARYLARAIPPGLDPRRYALVGQCETTMAKWKALGIHPVVFPQKSKDDFESLSRALEEIADRLSWRLGTWNTVLSRLLSAPPPRPFDPSDGGLLDDSIHDAVKARLILTRSIDPAWIATFEERRYLDHLFADGGTLSEAERLLATWFADLVTLPNMQAEVVSRVTRARTLHVEFWHLLSAAMGRAGTALAGADTRSLTMALLASLPDTSSSLQLSWLAEVCIARQEVRAAVAVYLCAAERALNTRANTHDAGGTYDVHDLEATWRTVWPAAQGAAAEILLSLLAQIEGRRRALEAQGRTWLTGDIDSETYPSIADDADLRHQPIVQIGRTVTACLGELLEHDPHRAKAAIELMTRSPSPFCRLLGARIQFGRTDGEPGVVAEWLLTRGDLEDLVTLKEFAPVAARLYEKSLADVRSKLADAVSRIVIRGEPGEHQTEISAFARIELLRAFCETGDGDDCVRAVVGTLEAQYPNARSILRSPAFFTRVGWVRHASPWSPEELLTSTPCEWLRTWRSFQPGDGDSVTDDEFVRYDQEGIRTALTEASARCPNWGLQLSEELARADDWECPLWPALLSGLCDERLAPGEVARAVEWLGESRIQRHHTMSVAKALSSLASRQGSSAEMLDSLNECAEKLESFVRSARESSANDDLLIRAIIEPAGVLAQYWIASLDAMRKLSPQIDRLEGRPLSALTRMTDLGASWTLLTAPVICAQFDWLSHVDDEWTTTSLLPWFTSRVRDQRRAAWHGFLTWGRLSPGSVSKLAGAFLEQLRSISDIYPHEERMLGFAASILVFGTGLDRGHWFAAALDGATDELKVKFSLALGNAIQHIPETELQSHWNDWIKDYWSNRNLGRPSPLSAREAGVMAGWLPSIGPVFCDAVPLAQSMCAPSLQHSSVLHNLAESEIPSREPEAVCDLLEYLESGNPPGWFWHKLPTILAVITGGDLTQARREWLIEFKLRRGIAESG
jgi:hypothetical protein